MKSFAEQFALYRQQHGNQSNQLIHFISIPAILISLLILMSWVSIVIAGQWFISFAWIGVILVLIYYYFLDVKLAVAMTVILLILTLICTWIAFPAPTKFSLILFLILLIGGGVLEFVGNSMGKTKPTLLTNVGQAVVAPLCLLAELITALGLGKYFNLASTKLPRNHKH